jgi:hypothetical protein
MRSAKGGPLLARASRRLERLNADEAVRILEPRNNVRLVFTDIDMPGTMGGVKLAAFVTLAARRNHPIGHNGPEDVRGPERNLFFPKPYDPEAVSQALRCGSRAGKGVLNLANVSRGVTTSAPSKCR